MKILSFIFVSLCLCVSAYAQDRAFLGQYCITCHNERAKVGGLALDKLDLARPGDNAETWEKVLVKLRGGMMPPSGARRPERPVMDTSIMFAAMMPMTRLRPSSTGGKF